MSFLPLFIFVDRPDVVAEYSHVLGFAWDDIGVEIFWRQFVPSAGSGYSYDATKVHLSNHVDTCQMTRVIPGSNCPSFTPSNHVVGAPQVHADTLSAG